MSEIKEENIEDLKRKLRSYKENDLTFNEPHFTLRLQLRSGNRIEVIKQLLNPNNLVYSSQKKGKYGDIIHSLYFDISNTKTMKLPVIFDVNNKKGLYIVTYILRYRPWQKMIKDKGEKNG